jgi:hypothetical protein
MTAVIAPESLDWVRFTGKDDAPCRFSRTDACTLEAVAAAVWEPACGCLPNPQPLCAGHRDEYLADALLCAGWFRCVGCGALSQLVRMEPLR